jgi:hypothetical protein
MDLTMRICEFEWREVDHNQFSGRTSSIHARGRVWSKNEARRQVICSGESNFGWFYSDVPGPLDDLIKETNDLVIMDLMDRNIIPKQWPEALLDNEADESEYPFQFKLIKTVIVNSEWTLSGSDAAKQSYVNMSVWSKHHGTLKSRCDLELPAAHIRKVFDTLDEIL